MISHRNGCEVVICDACFAVITPHDDEFVYTLGVIEHHATVDRPKFRSSVKIHGCSTECLSKALHDAQVQPFASADDIVKRQVKRGSHGEKVAA